MPCYSQQLAGPMPGRTKNGKTPYRFLGKASSWSGPAPLKCILLPCRQCIGCRLERSRQWATRLMHEANSHEKSCFLTLTYDDNHIPSNGSLNPSHFTTFIKDLRARLDYYGKEKIKYFACGEYGDQTKRPHYHLALFGPYSGGPIDFSDPDNQRIEEEPARSGAPQFSHPDIAHVWPHGLHRYSELSFEAAAYVARYILKKMSGIHAPNYYGDLVPEFQRASKGLGKAHFDEWTSDIYPADHVVLPGRGSFMPPPYYDRLLEKVDPALFQKVKTARQEAQKILTPSEWFEGVYERVLSDNVRTMVSKKTLIRGVL